MTQTLTSRDPSDPLFQPVRDSDPATPGDPLSRLRFHYGQCLSAEDFEAEQRYFVLRQRLHNALLHGVGTVWGLAIRRQEPPAEAGPRLICDPGMAIDPLGREIWVPQPLCLDMAALEASFWEQLQPPPRPEPPASTPAEAPVNTDTPTAADPTATGEQGGETQPTENPTVSQPPPPAVVAANSTPVSGPTDNPHLTKSRRAYVVLRYEACLSDAVPVIPLPCGDEHDGLAPSRLRDSFRLCLEAEAPPDPYATVRDITRRPQPAEPRARLLRHALNDPAVPPPLAPLERFWSGVDDAALLLATLDLKANGDATAEGLQPVALVQDAAPLSNPDNSVRAVLPAVQALADLALAIRLEGPSPAPAPFQVLGVTAQGMTKNPVSADGPQSSPDWIEIVISLSDHPLVSKNSKKSEDAIKQAVQLLVWDETNGIWCDLDASPSNPRVSAWEISSQKQAPAIQLRVEPAWSDATCYQVVLKGTGEHSLMACSAPPRPLAGVAGEVVPPGSGRDAFVFGTYTPTAQS